MRTLNWLADYQSYDCRDINTNEAVRPSPASADLPSFHERVTRYTNFLLAINMSTTPAPCDLLIGNSDFYGKGIRVGIYLQWLSSWISVLVQPGTAQAILEVNAIFVFAIVIATITAYTTTGVHPIEIYIMLHFSFGFYLTILSTFGVRLQMLRSWSAAKLLRAIRDLPRAIRESAVIIGDVPSLAELFENHPGDSGPQIARRWLANYLSAVREITTMRSEIKLDFLKFVKMQSLAWSGVLWRSDIAGVLAGLNLAFWFGGDPGRAAPGDCVPVPQVFMFSRQPLRGPLLTFFRVGAVAAAVVVFLPATFLVILSFRLTTYLLLCISRDVFWRGRADSRRRAQASFDRLNQVLEAKTVEAMMARQLRAQMALPGSTALSWMLFSFRSWRDFVKFFLSSDVEDIHATDILKLCASLADADVRVAEDVPRDRRLAADEEDGTRCVRVNPDRLVPVQTVVEILS